MLKAQILSAVGTAKAAVQDLAIKCQHVARGAAVVTPGAAPTYSETLTPVSIVFTRFDTKDVDNTRVFASDYKGLVFPETGLPPLEPNGIIRVSNTTDIAPGDYRIIDNDKVIAGDMVALHQLQLRMLSPS